MKYIKREKLEELYKQMRTIIDFYIKHANNPNFVEVVRCIDCIYNTLNTDGEAEMWCYKHGIYIEGDDFCSFGESKLEPKPVMTEEVREAIMRLTMCAREECSMCKYEESCYFDKQVEMATENMNTILAAFTRGRYER